MTKNDAPPAVERVYFHEEGSKFIRCVEKDTGDLLFIITAGRVENAEDVMEDLDCER